MSPPLLHPTRLLEPQYSLVSEPRKNFLRVTAHFIFVVARVKKILAADEEINAVSANAAFAITIATVCLSSRATCENDTKDNRKNSFATWQFSPIM